MSKKLEKHGLEFEAFLHPNKGTPIKTFFVCNEKKYMLQETGSNGLTRCLFDNNVTLPQWKVSALINDLIDAFGERKATNKPAKSESSSAAKPISHSLDYEMYNSRGRYFG